MSKYNEEIEEEVAKKYAKFLEENKEDKLSIKVKKSLTKVQAYIYEKYEITISIDEIRLILRDKSVDKSDPDEILSQEIGKAYDAGKRKKDIMQMVADKFGIVISVFKFERLLDKYLTRKRIEEERGETKEVEVPVEEPKREFPQETTTSATPKKKTTIDDSIIRSVLMNKNKGGLEQLILFDIPEEDRELLLKKIEFLKYLAEHARKIDDTYIPDKKFLEVLEEIEKRIKAICKYGTMKYNTGYENNLIIRGVAWGKGKMDVVKKDIFKDNKYLMTYILLGTGVEFPKIKRDEGPIYDEIVWEDMKEEYGKIVESYLKILHDLEEKKRRQLSASSNGSRNLPNMDDAGER